MKRVVQRTWFRLRWLLGRLLATVLLLGLLVWMIGPYERVDLGARFSTAQFGGDLDAYFERAEARFDDITPGVQKRVIWAGAPGKETGWAVLYVHGFSATSEEIRPVPDKVAAALGANLIFTRLSGHGRPGDAMAEGSVGAWMEDVAEGLAAARFAGRRTLVVATSTGATLMAAAAHDRRLMTDVAGMVLISPNFGINNSLAPLLTWPGARFWLPPLAGARRSFEALNDAHARYWTTEYPSVAVMPMAALVHHVRGMDFGLVRVPALFMFSTDDQIVRPEVTQKIATAWGAPARVYHPRLGPGDDPTAHVIAGDILSPGQTDPAVAEILDWARGL